MHVPRPMIAAVTAPAPGPRSSARLLGAVALLGLMPLGVLPATAAEVTAMPPALRGDVRLAYSADLFASPLMEADKRIGGARGQRHDLDLSLAFAPINGLAVTLGLEIAPARSVTFTDDTQGVVFDPVTGTGAFSRGAVLDPAPKLSGGGLTGLWIGVAAGPYGRMMETPDPFSWRFDVKMRVPNSGGTFYEAADGSRGGAPGGTAFLLSGAFAIERDFAEPYVTARYQHEGRAIVDIGDAVNGVTAPQATVSDPGAFDLRFGAELIAQENRETGLRVAIDLYGYTGYRTSARVASGVFLPDALAASRTIAVYQSEHLLAGAGLGIILNPAEAVGVRLSGDVAAITPYTVENVYAVRYGAGAHNVSANLTVTGRWR